MELIEALHTRRSIKSYTAQPVSKDVLLEILDADTSCIVRALLTAPGGRFVKITGCPACGGSGYKGRIGLFELFLLDNNLKALIDAKACKADLHRAAIKRGMRTLLMDGITKAHAGLTTLEEVLCAVAE